MVNVSIKHLLTLSSAIPKNITINIEEGEPVRSLLFKLCNKFGEDIQKYIKPRYDRTKEDMDTCRWKKHYSSEWT